MMMMMMTNIQRNRRRRNEAEIRERVEVEVGTEEGTGSEAEAETERGGGKVGAKAVMVKEGGKGWSMPIGWQTKWWTRMRWSSSEYYRFRLFCAAAQVQEKGGGTGPH